MLEVQLRELAFGGDAVGHLPDGRVVFVPYGAPGDRVSLRLTRQKKSMAWGEIVQILQPGPGRREAPCPLFGDCGGCGWQQLDYARQAGAKAAMVRSILGRLDLEPPELIPCDEELGYRRRVRLSWRGVGGGLILGFFRRRSKELLDVERCPLLSRALSDRLASLRCELAHPGPGRGSVVMVEGAGGEVVSMSARMADGLRRLAPTSEVRLIPEEQGELWGSAQAFCQANASQEAHMRKLVEQLAGPDPGRVLELYAGVGSLTLALAGRTEHLTAVETSPEAMALLRRNMHKLNGQVELRQCSAEQALAQADSRCDTLVLDPPREGAKGLAPAMAGTGANRVIYVSCDPMTLRRDVMELQEQGFRPIKATALDMMPQTHHVELVMLLERGVTS